MTRPTPPAPALRGSPASSCRDSSESKDAPRLFRSSPTRIARSGISGLRGFLRRRAREGSALGLRRRGRRAVRMAALERYDGGDGVLENQLLLIIGLEHQRVLVETLNTPGKLDSAQQVN